MQRWTIGRKLAAGFAATAFLGVTGCLVALITLSHALDAKDEVITVDTTRRVLADHLETLAERKAGAVRGYLLNPVAHYEHMLEGARAELLETMNRLTAIANEDQRAQLVDIGQRERANQLALEAVIALRVQQTPIEQVIARFESEVRPTREALTSAIAVFAARETAAAEAARDAANNAADNARTLVTILVIALALIATALALILARGLKRQIGAAVGQVQSSSAELQASAAQQASGAREQATAMTQITTTMNELLATSRQIAESAQSVSQIAGETSRAAKHGDALVDRTNEGLAGTRRQMDQVVGQMLDLGRTSQRVGAVLDLVEELSAQTHILAINATIEAAGAGEQGRRFGVVADEIRRLADRVAGSTQEIRALLDAMRSGVNGAVMATESGSKAVDAGTARFAELGHSLKQIAQLVATTSDAAREIELSTRQQATAVEQVNIAIGGAATATRENEASARQAVQTVTALASLSKDLLQMIQPERAN